MRLSVVLLTLTTTAWPALAEDWRRVVHPELGFSIEVPAGTFAAVADDDPNRLRFKEIGGEAQIEVFGAINPPAASAAEFRVLVEGADPEHRITYRANGGNWFVLSGYYGDRGPDELIFYAKFMLDGAGEALSAFEISYPRADKRRFDDVVRRMEKSLTRPRAAP